MNVEWLTVEDLLLIADGVLGEVLVRDIGLLQSAAERPRQSVFGEDAYSGLAEKSAALLHSIARNHPLVDGNKRLGWSAFRAFLLLNGWELVYTVDEAEQLVVSVASGDADVGAIAAWVVAHRAQST